MYVSGRTVKSRTARPTTLATATRDAHNLARKHLDYAALHDLVTCETRHTADLRTLAAQLRTTVTFPASTDTRAYAEALRELPGVVSVDVGTTHIFIVRTA